MLELGNHAQLDALARFGPHVEWGHPQSPALGPVAEAGDVLRLDLEEQLPDAPARGPRLKGDPCRGRADAGARHESEGRVESIADLLPVEIQIPAIVRVREPEASREIRTEHPVVGALKEQID